MIDRSCNVIINNDIPFMPYGHAIISEAREELSMMYIETSNAYSQNWSKNK